MKRSTRRLSVAIAAWAAIAVAGVFAEGARGQEGPRARAEVIGLDDDEFTPGIAFATSESIAGWVDGVPPRPRRQRIVNRAGLQHRTLLVWVPDESRLDERPPPADWPPRPQLPVAGVPTPPPAAERRTARFRIPATGEEVVRELWDFPDSAFLDPDAPSEARELAALAAEMERLTPAELRATSHVSVPNLTPAAYQALLRAFGQHTDPRPVLVGPHVGIPFQIYEVPRPLVRSLAQLDAASLERRARAWRTPGQRGSEVTRAWGLARFAALCRRAQESGARVYLYFDAALFG